MTKAKAEEPKKGPLDGLKEEIAQELGLWEKVQKHGWGGLTARESGRVGGIMTRRLMAGRAKRRYEGSSGRGQGNARRKGI